jgi:hypothetical protein
MDYYSNIEGEKSLNRCLLMMKYNSSKTLNENVMSIFEQEPESRFETQYNKDIMKKYYYTAKGSTISESLLQAREYLFTPVGMGVQIFLSVAGSEIGVPILFEVLDIAILVNDLILMTNSWENYQSNSEENWFMYQWNKNKYFQNSVVDIAFILTGGALKLAGMGAKAAYKSFISLLEKWGIKSISKSAEKIVEKIGQQKWKINKLPEPIKGWVNKFLNKAESSFNLWKNPINVVKSVVKKSPLGIVIGGLTYAGTKFLEDKIHQSEEEHSKQEMEKILGVSSVNLSFDDEIIACLMFDNPTIVSKKSKIQCLDEKCNKLTIDGVKYIYTNNDDTKPCKIKKIS